MTTSILDLHQTLQIARQIARQAGAFIKSGRTRGLTIEHKGEVDLVTDCDRASEAFIVAELKKQFSDHRIVGEEGSNINAEGAYSWFIDPIDGTTNFAHGLPWYAVSICLEHNGQQLVGVIYAPEVDWEFSAIQGNGALMNGQPIHVSRTTELINALVATGFSYDRRTNPDNNLAEFSAVLMASQEVRRIGVASLDCAMVALGWLDGYWEMKINAWDIAAGALLIKEAGGTVTNRDGNAFRSNQGHIIASNGHIHQELLATLKAARKS